MPSGDETRPHAWKASVPKGTVGSNPTLSAIQSGNAEAARLFLGTAWEIPAIPRGLGDGALAGPNQRP